MKNWRSILESYLETWKKDQNVSGALVCGSYVTGSPSPHSDVDVHIVLNDGVDWRERGNVISEGLLIEYFANPPKQIEKYFTDDYNDYSQMSPVQFSTGEILFDDGTVEILKKKAQEFLNKDFPQLPDFKIELNKYGLWDNLDNLEDAFEGEKKHFMFIFHNSLNTLIQFYCKYLGYPVIKFNKSLEILTDQNVRKKYLLKEFPDSKFNELCTQALCVDKPEKAFELYKELTKHVLDKIGGFEINGWKLRSPLDIDKK